MEASTVAQVQETVWLDEPGRSFGVPLALDDGPAGLVLADGTRLIVEVEPTLRAVHVHSEILRPPADAAARAALLEGVMVLNLHGAVGLSGGNDLRIDIDVAE